MFEKSLTEEKFTSFVQSLEQRLFFIEQKNYMLEQKINALQGENKVLREHLERRITDFTDVWHPMMMDNINRIKTELVNEVEKVNSDFVTEKINVLEQSLLEKPDRENSNNDPLNGHILVGYSVFGIPCFCLKNLTSQQIFSMLTNGTLNNTYCRNREKFTFIFESLLFIDDKQFDISWFLRGCKILLHKKLFVIDDKYNNQEMWMSPNVVIELIKTNREIDTIYDFCKNNGIEFVWNGKTHINNVSIDSLF